MVDSGWLVITYTLIYYFFFSVALSRTCPSAAPWGNLSISAPWGNLSIRAKVKMEKEVAKDIVC